MFSTHIAFTEQDQSCFNSGYSDIKLHQVNKQHNLEISQFTSPPGTVFQLGSIESWFRTRTYILNIFHMKDMYHSFAHLLIQQVSVTCLVQIRYCSGSWGTLVNKRKKNFFLLWRSLHPGGACSVASIVSDSL